jgi:DNA polymerase-3 subunit delta'
VAGTMRASARSARIWHDRRGPPEADRVEGAPHPRETRRAFRPGGGRGRFLVAVAGGRLHHAWLLTGPRGVGKATLAWRLAGSCCRGTPGPPGGLFGERPPAPPRSTSTPTTPSAPRAALSEPRLFLLRRLGRRKRLKTVITVDEVRGLGSFFACRLPMAGGGW